MGYRYGIPMGKGEVVTLEHVEQAVSTAGADGGLADRLQRRLDELRIELDLAEQMLELLKNEDK